MTLGPVTVRVPGVWSELFLPGASQAHLEYPATLSTFLKCYISHSLSCGSEMMVSARCVSVLNSIQFCTYIGNT